MTDSLVPDWIQNTRDRNEAMSAQARREHQEALLATKIIQADGAEFWKQLRKDLEIAIHSLHLIGVRAVLSDVPGGLQIRMNTESTMPRLTYTNLSYNGTAIHFHTMEDESSSWRLCVASEKVVLNADGRLLSGESAALAILEPILNRIGVAVQS